MFVSRPIYESITIHCGEAPLSAKCFQTLNTGVWLTMTLGCLIAIARLISTLLNVWRNQPAFAATYGSVALALTPAHITAFFRLNSDFHLAKIWCV